MIKYESFETEELEFVDPHVIQPITQQPTFNDLIGDQESNGVLSASQDDSNSIACDNSSDIRMEQCINLDLYLSPISGSYSANAADELNTPVFATTKELNFINIFDANGNPFTFPNKVKQENELGTNNQQSQMKPAPQTTAVIDFNETSVVHSDLTDSSLLSPNNALIMDEIDLNEYDLLSDCDEAILHNINDIMLLDNGNIIISDSGDCPEAAAYSQTTSLQGFDFNLDLGAKFDAHADTLQTPDVINTICSIEKDFDIFKFGNPIKEEYQFQPEESNHSISHPQPSPVSFSNQSTTNSTYPESSSLTELTPVVNKHFRLKARDPSDDDEDYVPPSLKKPKSKRRRSTVTDSDYQEEVVVKRGRPSKRPSDSSEHSGGSYRYREMRDKNNEASRKSREKRKIKEQQHESEMSGLEDRNMKLKAEVAELERTVSSFRSNLMQILMNK